MSDLHGEVNSIIIMARSFCGEIFHGLASIYENHLCYSLWPVQHFAHHHMHSTEILDACKTITVTAIMYVQLYHTLYQLSKNRYAYQGTFNISSCLISTDQCTKQEIMVCLDCTNGVVTYRIPVSLFN